MPTDLCLAHLVRRDWLTDGPLNKLIDLYIEALQNRRYARNTLSAYLRGLGHFSYWMRGEGLSVAGIDRALIKRFLRKRSARGVVATPRVLRYPSATEPFRSAASTAEA